MTHIQRTSFLCVLLFSALPGLAKPLTVDTAIRLFLDNSLDLKIQSLKEQGAKADTHGFLGIYDFIWKSDVNYTKAPFVDITPQGLKEEHLNTTTQIQKYLPFGVEFSLGWDWQNKDTQLISSLAPPQPSAKGHVTSLFLEARVPLLRNIFGSLNQLQLEQFKLSEHVAKLLTLKSIVSLVEDGIKIYQQWHIAKRSVYLKQANLNRAKKLLAINLEKQKDGLLEEGDIAQTQVGVKAREIELATTKTELNTASHIFAAFMNVDKSLIDTYETSSLEQEIDGASTLNTNIDMALESNIDIALTKTGTLFSSLALKEKETDQLVELNAVGRTMLKDAGPQFSQSWDNLFFDNPAYVAGLSLVIPLENHAKQGAYQKAYLSKQKSDIEFEKTKKQVRELYQNQRSTLATLQHQIQQSKKLLKLQKQKLSHEEVKFKQGRSSITFILQFQDELTGYELQYERLLTEYTRTKISSKLTDTSLLKEYKLDMGAAESL